MSMTKYAKTLLGQATLGLATPLPDQHPTSCWVTQAPCRLNNFPGFYSVDGCSTHGVVTGEPSGVRVYYVLCLYQAIVGSSDT